MSFAKVMGHLKLVHQFQRAASNHRLGQAYLFVGPEGVGKHTFAIELARAVLCENPPGVLDACDSCQACLWSALGTHPDFFQAGREEGSLLLKLAVMKQLIANLAMKPVRGRRKVAIVDQADAMNDESANAFLKTLEEPPPNSLLILIAAGSVESLFSTIVSRCQVIPFSPLDRPTLDALLRERGIADSGRRDRLIALSAGAPGMAVALEDDALWEFRSQLLQRLSTPRFDFAGLLKEWVDFIEEAGKESLLKRRRAVVVHRLLIDLLQKALHASLGDHLEGMDEGETTALKQLAERLGTDKLMAWIDRVLEADFQIERGVQISLAIESLVDRLARG